MHYDYLFIDSNYILRRNFSVMRWASQLLSYELLIKSFLNSIFKLNREVDGQYIILGWDKGPYYCTEKLLQYKKDREYVTESDVAKTQEDLSKETDEVKRKELEKKLEEQKLKAEQEAIFNHAKNALQKYLAGTYFNSTLLKGYECDNLAYLISDRLPKNKKILLVTIDSDWIYFTKPNADLYRLGTKGRIGTYIKADDSLPAVQHAKRLGITLYQHGVCREIYYGGHNNVPPYPHQDKLEYDDFAKLMVYAEELKDELSLPEYKEYYKSLNINFHQNNDVYKVLDEALNPHKDFSVASNNLKSYLEYLKFDESVYQNYSRLKSNLSIDAMMAMEDW